MPIRLVCPGCSTQLNVKDEYAGRAVKCPKCGDVIPATKPTSPLPQATAPRSPAVEETVEPVPRARPVRSADSSKSSRDRAEESPSHKRVRRKERDEPEQRRSSNTGVILAVVGFFLLACCGGISYGVYWFFNKAKETVNEVVDNLKPKNDKLTQANYDRLNDGMTRGDVEAILGKGRTALPADLATVFHGEAAGQIRLEDWTPKVQRGRVMLWQDRDDYLLVAFYPNGDTTSRVQLKALARATGAPSQSGNADDDTFARKHLLARPDGTPGGPPVQVSAEQLIRDYLADQNTADAKYRDKLVAVSEGVLERWEGDAALVYPKGKKGEPNRIRVTFLPAMRPQFTRYKPGDSISFRGKCESRAGTHIVVTRGEFQE